jgi:hypothetical protein
LENNLDLAQLKKYQDDPLLAAKEALEVLRKNKMKHDDMEWRHVALLPRFNPVNGVYDLKPVLIDLTRVSKCKTEKEAQEFHDWALALLSEQLQ